MLAFARKQPLQARNIDLNEIIGRAAVMLRRTIGEDVAVKLALAEGLWPALADPAQIEDVILNLAVNARDAMPNGGQLVIETANVYLDEQYAAQNLEVAAGDYVSVVVTDSGTGHAAGCGRARLRAVLHHQGGRQGHGLGLSMVYGFVKQSRGHVKIYSEVGHGTSIKLYLPRAVTTADGGRGPRHAPTANPAATRSILVVEDSADGARRSGGILRGLGYRVREAEDGHAALAILNERARSISCSPT
jgi:signal transduction histidine kinase